MYTSSNLLLLIFFLIDIIEYNIYLYICALFVIEIKGQGECRIINQTTRLSTRARGRFYLKFARADIGIIINITSFVVNVYK